LKVYTLFHFLAFKALVLDKAFQGVIVARDKLSPKHATAYQSVSLGLILTEKDPENLACVNSALVSMGLAIPTGIA
jgi:hypothetical protein